VVAEAIQDPELEQDIQVALAVVRVATQVVHPSDIQALHLLMEVHPSVIRAPWVDRDTVLPEDPDMDLSEDPDTVGRATITTDIRVIIMVMYIIIRLDITITIIIMVIDMAATDMVDTAATEELPVAIAQDFLPA